MFEFVKKKIGLFILFSILQYLSAKIIHLVVTLLITHKFSVKSFTENLKIDDSATPMMSSL